MSDSDRFGDNLKVWQGESPHQDELDIMRRQIGRAEEGTLAPEKFKAYRLTRGTYGQRQAGVQMIRVRIPNGILNSDQLLAFAEIAENHGHGIAHVTTRQDVQYHHIPLDEVPRVLEILAGAGLHTREACGNSVRNITCCPYSGVCPGEPFPVTLYAQAVARFLLRHPAAQLMGRKFKIAFSGCDDDCASGAIHDIGAIAQVRRHGNQEERGFRMLVGGGLGATPYIAEVLDEFLPAEELLSSCDAIVRLFANHGERRVRARARLKFLVARLGITEFQRLYHEERERIRDANGASHIIEDYLTPEEQRDLAVSREKLTVRVEEVEELRAGPDYGVASGFNDWVRRNTRHEKRGNYRSVTVALPLGDIDGTGLRCLARILDRFGSGEMRTTIRQNLVIHSVKEDDLKDAHAALQAAGLADPVAGTATDIVSCPGTDTCGIGITSSRGLAVAIEKELGNSGIPAALLSGISINLSGCPNGCSQHHVAGIGLHGVARKVNGVPAPYYQLHLGGEIRSENSLAAKGTIRIPASHTPQAIRILIERYLEERTRHEPLPHWLRQLDLKRVEEWLGDLLEPESLNPELSAFVDWNRTEPFSTAAIGQGECAGAGVDLGPDLFEDSAAGLREARFYVQHGQWVDALAEARRALIAAGRITLEQGAGKRCSTDWEVICEFRARLIDRGHASDGWNDLLAEGDELLCDKDVPADRLESWLGGIDRFLEEARKLQKNLQVAKNVPGAPGLPGLFPRALAGRSVGSSRSLRKRDS